MRWVVTWRIASRSGPKGSLASGVHFTPLGSLAFLLQASPLPSLSLSFWSALGTYWQLSLSSGTPSLSSSKSMQLAFLSASVSQ